MRKIVFVLVLLLIFIGCRENPMLPDLPETSSDSVEVRVSEYIKNGDFSSGFDYWINGPGGTYAFDLDTGMALAKSDTSTNELCFQMYQSFSISDEVIAANIWAWCKWNSLSNVVDYAHFIVDLKKPDSTWVNLLNEKWINSEGNGYRLNGNNVKAHFTQQGTYYLYLTCRVYSTDHTLAKGWYDNISLKISVKKYKSVIEKLAMPESLGKGSTHEESEIVKFAETLDSWKGRVKVISEQVKFGELTFRKVKKTVLEVLKVAESYIHSAFNFKEASEAVKFVETLTPKFFNKEEYSKDSIAFSESLSAKKTAGNVETSIQITDLIEWEDIAKKTTKWRKYKVEV